MEDIETARLLFDKGKNKECLFFTHLAMEKALKARVVAHTNEHAPKIHNLVRLANLAEITLTESETTLLFEFNQYCMAGRYPDAKRQPIDRPLAAAELERGEEALKWLL